MVTLKSAFVILMINGTSLNEYKIERYSIRGFSIH